MKNFNDQPFGNVVVSDKDVWGLLGTKQDA